MFQASGPLMALLGIFLTDRIHKKKKTYMPERLQGNITHTCGKDQKAQMPRKWLIQLGHILGMNLRNHHND